MDPVLSEEQQMLLDTAESFLKNEAPVSSARDRESAPRAFDADYWKKGAELGWTSMLVPEDLGGAAVEEPILDIAVVAELFGRFVAPGPLLPGNVVVDALVRTGSDEQKTQYLGELTDGSITASWAFAEGEAWDLAELATTATRDGEDYVLNGTKSSVEAADTADLFLVTARAENAGTQQFLVPEDTSGLTVTPLPGLDLARRFGDVELSGVRVPASAELGDSGRAAADVARQQLVALTLQAAETVGLMETMFDAAVEYMKSRYTFGRPLASYQALKHRLADHMLALQQALGISSALAHAVNDGDPDAEMLASVAKSHIGDQSMAILSDCAQFFGGIAMTWEHDHHLYMRRVTVNHFLYGSPAQHRERLCQLAGV